MRCLSAMTVVESGEGISRRRSGIEVVKRTVRRSGGGFVGAEGSRKVDILRFTYYDESVASPLR